MSTSSNIQRIPLQFAVQVAFSDFESRLNGITDLSTPFLAGPPGGGKTQSIRAEAAKRGMEFVCRNLGLIKLEELGGIPEFMVEDDELRTRWSVPELISEIRRKAKNAPVVVLLDDWHIAGSQVQALGFELFSDYSLKGYKVPKNTFFILAGNDSAAAGARASFSAVMNRVAKMYVETEFDYWRDQVAIPMGIWDPIVSFLNSRDYRRFFHGEEQVMDPFPSPRSWTNLSFKLNGLMSNGILKYDNSAESTIRELAIYASHVGVQAASEFQTFYKVYSSFDMKSIFDFGKYKVPDEAAERYAFTTAISSEFYNRCQENKATDSKVYVKILKDLNTNYPEMAITSVRFLGTRDVGIIKKLAQSRQLSPALLQKLMQTSQVLR